MWEDSYLKVPGPQPRYSASPCIPKILTLVVLFMESLPALWYRKLYIIASILLVFLIFYGGRISLKAFVDQALGQQLDRFGLVTRANYTPPGAGPWVDRWDLLDPPVSFCDAVEA